MSARPWEGHTTFCAKYTELDEGSGGITWIFNDAPACTCGADREGERIVDAEAAGAFKAGLVEKDDVGHDRDTERWAIDIIGRPETPVFWHPAWYHGKDVVVTGSKGSLGPTLCAWLTEAGANVYAFDLPHIDLRDRYVGWRLPQGAEVVLHLAGAKSAPDGENNPEQAVDVNSAGTIRVLERYKGQWPVCRVVVVSTCKAADPETAYGASKLLAEKAAIESHQRVVRLVNVVDTKGNVFDTWRHLPDGEPIQVAGECVRMFMTRREACSLILRAAQLDPGRYALRPKREIPMYEIAHAWSVKHNRRVAHLPLRRGDRVRERLLARCEQDVPTDDPLVMRIRSAHDPVDQAA